MFDPTHFLLASARAAEADTMPPPTDESSTLMRFVPLFLIFMIFYFVLIRPQQKKMDQQNAMVKALKKGDRIVTSGGIVGTVTGTEGDEYLMVAIAEGVTIKIVRSNVNALAESDKTDKKTDKAEKAHKNDKADKAKPPTT